MNWLRWWPLIPSPMRQLARRAILRGLRASGRVMISDTTLRDGEQMPGVRLLADEKLQIALALESAGVHSIDAGFAACGAAEVQSIQRLVGHVERAILTSLCRTLRSDIDRADEALQGAAPLNRGVSLFAGTSDVHRQHKLHKEKTAHLRMIGDTVSYAASKFEIVSFGAEDASRTEPEFLCECFEEAIQAGASSIGFADTVGILTPEKTRDYIRLIQDDVQSSGRALLAVHFHNDLGLAVANSLAAVAEGAHIVQGTILGLGERAGNAAIEEVVLALDLHREQYARCTSMDLGQLYNLCQLVSQLTGIPIPPNKPVAGKNVFATEAGIHQDGLLKHATTYLPYETDRVGGPAVRFVIGKHSGRQGLAYRLKELGINVSERELGLLLRRVKELPKEVDPDDNATLKTLVAELKSRTRPKRRTKSASKAHRRRHIAPQSQKMF